MITINMHIKSTGLRAGIKPLKLKFYIEENYLYFYNKNDMDDGSEYEFESNN